VNHDRKDCRRFALAVSRQLTRNVGPDEKMRTPPYIERVVAPICRCSIRGNSAYIERFHGTGFFINGTELF
jgi:hypothetical protein